MGNLSKVTRAVNIEKVEQVNSGSGSHAIDANRVLEATDTTVITPMNQPAWSTVRTEQVRQNPEYMTEEEVKSIKNKSRTTTKQAKETVKAYQHLEKIEKNDRKVHRAHRKYIRTVASVELSKKCADTTTAVHLHKLRPTYAKQQERITQADTNAQQAIQEMRNKIRGVIS